MQTMYAVVAATQHVAELHREAFGLDREIWEAHGYTAPITGRQYQRIVMIRQHWVPTAAEMAEFEHHLNYHWRPRLAQGAILKVI